MKRHVLTATMGWTLLTLNSAVFTQALQGKCHGHQAHFPDEEIRGIEKSLSQRHSFCKCQSIPI